MTHITQTWIVKRIRANRLKYCSRCATKMEFISSRKFRCNTNGKSIDVWLIYNCFRCKNSWNMPVDERQRVSSIPPDRLQKYYANDVEHADRVGEGEVSTEYVVSKKVHYCCEPMRVKVLLCSNIKLRADRFFAKKLGVSRSGFDNNVSAGLIRCSEPSFRGWNRPIRHGQIVEIDGDLSR